MFLLYFTYMKNTDKTKVIVLDFDGTLVDSFPVLQAAYRQFNLDLGSLSLFQERMKFLKFFGQQKIRTFYHFLTQPIECRRLGHDLYTAQAKLFDGMAETLSQLLKRQDVKLFILSQNFTVDPQKMIRAVLERNNVQGIEKISIHTISARTKKSNFLKDLIEKMNIQKDSIFVAGDEFSDFRSFRRLGLKQKAIVSYGYDSFQKLFRKKVPVDSILKTPQDLIQRMREFVERR